MKIFKTANILQPIRDYYNEDISISRLSEILNEIVDKELPIIATEFHEFVSIFTDDNSALKVMKCNTKEELFYKWLTENYNKDESN